MHTGENICDSFGRNRVNNYSVKRSYKMMWGKGGNSH